MQRDVSESPVEDQPVNRMNFSTGFFALEVGRQCDGLAENGGFNRFLICREFAPNAVCKWNQNRPAGTERSVTKLVFAAAVHELPGLRQWRREEHVHDALARKEGGDLPGVHAASRENVSGEDLRLGLIGGLG